MDLLIFENCKEAITEEEFRGIVDERNLRIQNGEAFFTATSVFSIISLICSVGVAILIVVAMFKQTVSKRKFLVLLSKSASDAISTLIIACIGIFASLEAAYFSITSLALFVCTFGFMKTTLCNALLMFIRQMSHEKITFFKSFLNVNRVAWILLQLWVASVLYLAIYAPLILVLFKPYNGCSFYSCQKSLLIIAIAVMVILLTAAICYYLFVVRCIFTSMVKERANSEDEISRRRLKRFLAFGLNVSLYAVISLLMLVLMILAIKDGFEIDRILQDQEKCHIFEYLEAVNRVQSLCSGVVLLWIVRATFDPILMLIIEHHRLLPWLQNFSSRRSDDEAESTFSSVQRSESLKWKRNNNEVHCSVADMEPAISAWESPKSQHSDTYKDTNLS